MKPWAIAGLIMTILLLLLFGSAVKRQIAPTETRRVPKTNVIEIKPTLAEITNATFAFFDSRGNPVVGYVESGANLSLFPQPTGTSPGGATISPISKDKVERYTAILRERAIEAERISESRAAAEKEQALITQIQRENEESEQQRIRESNAVVSARIELAQYRDRYLALSSVFDRAVLIIDEHQNQNSVLSSFIVDWFRGAGSKTSPSFFKPAFVKDGLFDKVFSGQTDAANRLQFTNILQSIVLGRQSVSYSTNPSLQDIVTANMTLELSTAFTHDLQPSGGQTLRATAAGFSRDEARLSAEEKIMSQLTNGVLQKFDKSLSQK